MQRSDYLGSSDAKDIVNLEPYGCRRAMVYRKAGVPVDDAERQAVRFSDDEGPVARGIELEEKGRERIRKKIGMAYEWRGPTIATLMPPRPPVPDWFAASPDGIVGGLNDEERARLCRLCKIHDSPKLAALLAQAGICEIKTVMSADLWRMIKAGPRQDFILQTQHQMAATAARWCLLVIFNADSWRWLYVLLERDPEWERSTYLPAAYDAWNQIMRAKSGIDLGASPDLWEPFLPPRLKEGSKQCRTCDHRRTCWGSAYASVMEIPVEGDAANLEGDPAWAAAVADYQGASEVLAECEAIKEDAAERIKAIMGDRPVAEGAGLRVYFKPQTRRTLDTKAIQKDHPEITAKYMKESTTRPLRAYQV